jgi:hypothetical protein
MIVRDEARRITRCLATGSSDTTVPLAERPGAIVRHVAVGPGGFRAAVVRPLSPR